EWPIYSLHIDSVLCHTAHIAGIEEVILASPMRIYHIEHSVGSGATPEGMGLLLERMKARGIPCLDWAEVADWIIAMRSVGRPKICNDENWGLRGEALRETVIDTGSATRSPQRPLAA